MLKCRYIKGTVTALSWLLTPLHQLIIVSKPVIIVYLVSINNEVQLEEDVVVKVDLLVAVQDLECLADGGTIHHTRRKHQPSTTCNTTKALVTVIHVLPSWTAG